MTISASFRAINNVRHEESGEGVGARDQLEGLKHSKGEITKQIEQLKEGEEQYKTGIRELKNKIAEFQGRNAPEMKKRTIQIEGHLKGLKAQVQSDKDQLANLTYLMKVELKSGTPNSALEEYRKGIKNLEKRIDETIPEIKKYEKELENSKQEEQNIRDAIAHYQRQLTQYQQQLANVQSQLAMATAQKKSLEVQLKYMAGLAIKQNTISKETGKKVDAVHAEQGTVAG